MSKKANAEAVAVADAAAAADMPAKYEKRKQVCIDDGNGGQRRIYSWDQVGFNLARVCQFLASYLPLLPNTLLTLQFLPSFLSFPYQELEEVTIYIDKPLGVRARDLDIEIAASSVRVGLKGNPPFMDQVYRFNTLASVNHYLPRRCLPNSYSCILSLLTVQELCGAVDTSQSVWMIEDDELVLTLQKQKVGDVWPGACKAHAALTDAERQQVQQKVSAVRVIVYASCFALRFQTQPSMTIFYLRTPS
jgi:hypothetical protein